MEKYPRGTQIFHTQVSPFYFPSSSSHLFFLLHLSSILLRSSTLQIWRLDHPSAHLVQSSNQPDRLTQRSIVQSTRSSHRSSSVLWSSKSFLFKSILPLFFFRSVFLCSSSNMFFFKYKNRVLETRFCFLELKSTRLEIYVASYVQLT